MHTYQSRTREKDGALTVEWVVGFSIGGGLGSFRVIGVFDAEDDAAAYTSYLNGGDKTPSGPKPLAPTDADRTE